MVGTGEPAPGVLLDECRFVIWDAPFPTFHDDVVSVGVGVQDCVILDADNLIIKVRFAGRVVINIINDIFCRCRDGIFVLVQLCFHVLSVLWGDPEAAPVVLDAWMLDLVRIRINCDFVGLQFVVSATAVNLVFDF